MDPLPEDKRPEEKVDPDFGTWVAIYAGGVATLLALAAMAQNQWNEYRRSKDTTLQIEAERTVRVAVDRISKALSYLYEFWRQFVPLGENRIEPGNLRFGRGQKFLTDAQYDLYQRNSEEVINAIGQINSAVGDILNARLIVSESLGQQIQVRCTELASYCNLAVYDSKDTETVIFQVVPQMLNAARSLSEEMLALLG